MRHPLARRGTARLARILAAAGATVVALSLGCVPAHAAASSTPIPSITLNLCGLRSTSASLTGLGDKAQYFPAKDGAFEAGASSWWLTNAQVVQANEPWRVLGSGGHALQINAGGSAQSSLDCNTNGEDAARFFYRAPGVSGSALKVTVDTFGPSGLLSGQTYTLSGAQSGWMLSPTIAIPNGRLMTMQFVRITFAASGAGSWQLDDVLIDPWRAL